MKPTFCSYMGLYILRHLKKSVLGDGKDISVFANDFCANAKDSVKERLLFVNDIYTVQANTDLYL